MEYANFVEQYLNRLEQALKSDAELIPNTGAFNTAKEIQNAISNGLTLSNIAKIDELIIENKSILAGDTAWDELRFGWPVLKQQSEIK